MADLKLHKLPDRTPVKMTISIAPDLKRALDDYAEIYRDTYGEDGPVPELIPQMLGALLAGDRAFVKARKALAAKGRSNA